MKYIKTFENKMVKENKYTNTWYKDINLAKTFDREDKKRGGSGYENQRSLVKQINPDISWDNKSDREVSSYLNNLKKEIVSEVKDTEMRSKIDNMLASVKINIDLGRDWVDEEHSVRFVRPLIWDLPKQDVIDFLKDTNEINVVITNRNPKKFDVYYDGYIKNTEGDKIEFENISNGFAIQMG